MPIDSSIPLSVKSPELPSPLEVFSTVTQIQAQREAAELRRLAAEEARQKKAEQSQLDELYASSVTTDPETGQVSMDFNKMLRDAPGHLKPSLYKQMVAEQKEMNDLIKSRFDLDESERKWLGARGRDILLAEGAPEVWRTMLLQAKQTRAIDAPTYARLNALSAPEDILPVAKAWVQGASGTQKLEKVSEYNAATGQTVDKFVVPTEGASFVQPPKAGAGAANLQAKEVLLDGRPALATFNPDTGTFNIGGQDVTARVRPIPPPNPLQLVSVVGPDGKPVLVPEGQAVGKVPGSAAEGPGGVKLSPTQQEDISTMLTVQDLSKTVLKRGEATSWSGVGPVAGRVGSVAAQFEVGSPEAEELRNFIGNIQGTIAKLRGGTAFSPQEKAMLDSYTPTPNDSVLKIKAKLKSLDLFITAKRENMLRVAGGEYTPRDTSVATVAKEGDVKPIPGHPGTEQTYRNGKWIRTK